MKIILTTANTRGSGTKDPIKLYVGGYSWQLDNPFCEDFAVGKITEFNLSIPSDFTSDWFQFLCLKKHQDTSGKWVLRRLILKINDRVVYDSGNINYVFEAGKTTWCAKDFFYGKCHGNVSPDFDIYS